MALDYVSKDRSNELFKSPTNHFHFLLWTSKSLLLLILISNQQDPVSVKGIALIIIIKISLSDPESMIPYPHSLCYGWVVLLLDTPNVDIIYCDRSTHYFQCLQTEHSQLNGSKKLITYKLLDQFLFCFHQ